MRQASRFALSIALLLLAAPVSARGFELVADALVPGFGSFYTGHYGAGTAIGVGRIGTAYLSYYQSQRAREYQSAEKAARIAELYFGPGYRFKNPYGSGYYSAAEYGRMAGKRKFYANIGIVVHVGIAIASGLLTSGWLDEAEATPVFPDPRTREQPVTFGMKFTF
ncbi:MAG: hypothetical protein JNM27_08415 [Leptospirales bacterium]|nr:hypothetical protein [Leptospirales bacterium]